MLKKGMRFGYFLIVSLIMGCAANPLWAAGEKGPSASSLRAQEKSHDGDYEGAGQIYKAILEKAPADIAARLGLAQTLYWQGDYAGAAGAYAKILEKDPDHVEALVGSGKAYLAMGKQKKAQGFFSRAEKIDPSSEETAAVASQIGKKASIEIVGGYILGHFNYAADMQGEYQRLAIRKEGSYAFGLDASYLNKFTQSGFYTELFGGYHILEGTRIEARVGLAPETAIFPKQSYGAGLSQTFGKIGGEVQYLFEDYRQARVQTFRPALYFRPLEFLKIGGGYQLQSVQFLGARRNLNGGFAEIDAAPFEWLSLNGYYQRTNNAFEAGRLPTPYVGFLSNVGGGAVDVHFVADYSLRFDLRFESRNNGEASQAYTLSAGYLF